MRKFIAFILLSFFLTSASVNVDAQTRLYLFKAITMVYSPTVNAGWSITTGNGYGLLMPNKSYGITTAVSTITSGASGAAAPKKLLCWTYITQPLQAQTLSSGSTISMQIRMNANGTGGVTTHTGFIYARVMNEDGTIAAEIGNVASGGGVLSTTATNRTFSLTLGSNVSIPANGRIVIEVGTNFSAGSATTLTGTIVSYAVPTVADLPVDNTTTTALDPWIEFSQTLKFAKGFNL